MSPEETGNQDPRTKVENFNDIVNSIIEANDSRPFDGPREQSNGKQAFHSISEDTKLVS